MKSVTTYIVILFLNTSIYANDTIKVFLPDSLLNDKTKKSIEIRGENFFVINYNKNDAKVLKRDFEFSLMLVEKSGTKSSVNNIVDIRFLSKYELATKLFKAKNNFVCLGYFKLNGELYRKEFRVYYVGAINDVD